MCVFKTNWIYFRQVPDVLTGNIVKCFFCQYVERTLCMVSKTVAVNLFDLMYNVSAMQVISFGGSNREA